MSSISLEVAPREIVGKKVKQLRHQGIVPGVIYGPLHQEAIPIQMEWAKLRTVLSQAGGTSLVNLDLPDQKISVLIRDVHRHPYRAEVLHVDFYAVDMSAKIKVTIPVIVLNQEAEAKRLAARIFQPVNRITVECLPADLPPHVEVKLSHLRRAGQNITISQLPELDGVTYMADPNVIVVRTLSVTRGQKMGDEVDFEDDTPVSMEVEVIKRGKDEEEEF